jgi:peptidoglycan/LPS O-acetylase OafA/YrhL
MSGHSRNIAALILTILVAALGYHLIERRVLDWSAAAAQRRLSSASA